MHMTSMRHLMLIITLSLTSLMNACDNGGGSTSVKDALTTPMDAAPSADTAARVDAAGCPPGSQNCPCAAGDACDDGLSCQEGFCITAAPCPAGTDGCPCDAGSCGEGLSCQADVCAPSTPCPAGTDGCLCDAGACGEGLSCQDNVCAPSTPCPVGTLGCPCGPNDACDAGGLCGAGVCQPAGEGQRIAVNDSEIRACDLLLEIDPAAALSVTLSPSIKGRHRRREGRVAIAWIALEDAAPQGAVIQLAGGPAQLILTECYGRHGEPLAEPGLRLE